MQHFIYGFAMVGFLFTLLFVLMVIVPGMDESTPTHARKILFFIIISSILFGYFGPSITGG